jgi:hypothetical protein
VVNTSAQLRYYRIVKLEEKLSSCEALPITTLEDGHMKGAIGVPNRVGIVAKD